MKMKIPNHEEEDETTNPITNARLCDFCSKSTAILYCKADSAKLCFSCDREVHSTNNLFTKHTRSLLCDACDTSPATILCSTDNLVLCQNCDWEAHGRLGATHDRRPIEGFIGCPNVCELCSIVGFEDLGSKKAALFSGEELNGDADYGFEDLLVWETPTIFSLDDLIGGGNDNDHGFRAMGVPPLPKNRNATCGLHKEEILRQLRKMAMLEPDMKNEHVDDKPLVHEQNLLPRDMYIGCEHADYGFVFPAYEASAFHLRSDNSEGANQFTHSSVLGSYNDEEICLVPNKPSHADDVHQEQSHHPLVSKTLAFVHKVHAYEYNSQDRDTALTRYKEKKKNRRYDRQVRYESRKARAESRTRIKGRFAKIEH